MRKPALFCRFFENIRWMISKNRNDLELSRGGRQVQNGPERGRGDAISSAGLKGGSPHRGAGWKALLRGRGDRKSPGRVEGRQPLIWVQGCCSSSGRAFSTDRSGAETEASCTQKRGQGEDIPFVGSRADSPAQLSGVAPLSTGYYLAQNHQG